MKIKKILLATTAALNILGPAYSSEFVGQVSQNNNDLCSFTKDVISVLSEYKLNGSYENLESVERLHAMTHNNDSSLKQLALQFLGSIKEPQIANQEIGDVVTGLGRLLKCSVDDQSFRGETAFKLTKNDISGLLSFFSERVKRSNLITGEENYHKLMMSALADDNHDIALYAYLKIAESRCKDEEDKCSCCK
tara:strand:+ start:44 stop:622 length:579 start_codon:yes stop_codon:yes gene_type:complete